MRYEYKLERPNFTVKNIDILNVARSRGFTHIHKDGRMKHGIIFTASGTMKYDMLSLGESYYVKRGELIFIPKDCVYSGTYFDDNTEIKIVQFDIEGEAIPQYMKSPGIIDIPEVAKMIEEFFNPIKNHVQGHPFYYLSCLYDLLWRIDESFHLLPSKYKKLGAALTELTEYYYKNEKVSYYAELCEMSEVNFRRLFREYTGCSPIEYRNDIRLNEAKIKLLSGEYNVSEVAEITGFSNLSFFIRLYKKKFGYTPKKE